MATKLKLERAAVLQSKLTFDEKTYEFDDSFIPADISNPMEVHTTAEMVACLERNPNIELDAKVLGKQGKIVTLKECGKEKFVTNFKESSFDDDTYISSSNDDFVPMLGGPFYKNLYFYQDYIRMHGQSFYAYHHDPLAKLIVAITKDFTLGRGFRIDSENKVAIAVWESFVEANDFQEQFNQLATELSIYGEDMLWWLPNNESKITYQLNKEDIPKAILPRVRLVDPSNIIEIVTYPEDITRRLFYVWLAPTQYQLYGGQDPKTNKVQPTAKFIYRQIPADQMMHFKINSVSNEKRGRSDFYPVLGYLKRLRDAVNFGMVALQKQSAWAIDTTIDGSQADIDAYVDAQTAMGTIPAAGSEFVHTTKVTRQFLSNQAGRGGQQDVFDWAISMVAAGVQIPVSYFGTHLSGGQTRASALVSTEPVAKKFEMRQEVYKGILKKVWNRLMSELNLGFVDCEITFPEIITQDRSSKLKDLALAESQGWIKKERAASIAAKELGIADFKFEEDAGSEMATPAAPLTTPGQTPAGMTGDQKKQVKDNYGF
jgi:hypothetical protein